MGEGNNFGHVSRGIYRSAFPNAEIHAQHLNGIKTILKLVDTPYPCPDEDFIASMGIKVHTTAIRTTKVAMDETTIQDFSVSINQILTLLINTENHPVLVHCNQGKHRTGCVIGCFRRLQLWDIDDIIAEYRQYAGPKARPLDESLIRAYEPGDLWKTAQEANVSSWS
ncbi:hypothetical protein N7457_002232 [Penicillium paradoxum]|uniref:uncharacterized protein n=1 Tax=Penicillium paradoxum TaxID=176176 RepID=UPI002547A8CD|nr:uncharacterized protein N7457_002232 [Penicillium paradoxum]KAJ5787242.1 hypothetical protein N7457_002232 [Penicillium paradoxum]